MQTMRTSSIFVLAAFLSLASASGLAAEGISRKENLDLPFDSLETYETEEAAPEVVVFFGQAYECDAIFYCLDRSSSTCRGVLALEKREAIRKVQEFLANMQFGFVYFDRGIRKFPSDGRPARATPDQKSAAISYLSALQCGGGTCVLRGMLETLKYVSLCNARRAVVVYMGDGGTSCPGADLLEYARRALRQIRKANTKNVPIHALVGAESWFAKELVRMNNGKLTPLGLGR
jgi:hypothetical protein